MTQRPLLIRLAIAAGRGLRNGWLMVGLSLLTIVLLESTYRELRFLQYAWLAGDAEPPSPFEQFPWARDYWVGHQKEEATEWAPYVYLRNPSFSAPHATVDAAGHRVTPVAVPPTAGPNVVRVLFLGGSTTFGWYQRTAYTFPAEGARRVQALLGDAARVEVMNFGVPGRTFTQEVIDLMLALRAGARPDVVVFLDGINDVMATVQNGAAGQPQNEWNREADFNRGQRLRAPISWRNDVRAVGASVVGLASRLQVIQRMMVAVGPAPTIDVARLSRSITDMYVGNVRLVESMAAAYQFTPIYVWQPALLSTTKPLTPREAFLNQRRDPFVRMVRAVHVAVPPLLVAAVPPVVAGRFIDATHVFRGDRDEVFVDLFGHTYERANPIIMDAMRPALEAAVARVRAASRDPAPARTVAVSD